ncbi:MAG: choice-of-anchor J domain-containing protein, partial [Muribaculaceae bacterium]|nr:choice-of-anchor J domain-containing protein [Muribaculaceae bacterium]
FYTAHSGHQYLVSMAVTDSDFTQKRSDDWAISPQLNGKAQTISFWAKSMLADALETIEVLYSTSGTDLDDFTSVATFDNVPWEWKQYYFDIPAGAKHFALRCVTRDGYILMVDDVNFTPADNAASLDLSGYNVYRNGVKINEAPVTSTSYADQEASDKNAVYNVTAIYTGRGESMFSNDAIATQSGLRNISDDSSLVIVATYTLSGVKVDNNPAPGIYIRRYSDGSARKVTVK